MGARNVIQTSAIVMAAAVGIAVSAAPALAAEASDVTIASGGLSVSSIAVSDFAGVTIDGSAKTTTASLDPFSVTDARGTGGGWNVTVQATPFAEWDGLAYVASGRTLPDNSLSMTAPTVAANGTTSADPSLTAGPYTLDGGSAVKFASAGTDTGMGTYDFTPGASAITLSVPGTAFAATYRSELTVSVVAGP